LPETATPRAACLESRPLLYRSASSASLERPDKPVESSRMKGACHVNDPHTHVAVRTFVGATRRAELRHGERASRNASEPDSASLRFHGSGQPSRDGEASTRDEAAGKAVAGLPGVVGGGACGTIRRGTGETRRGGRHGRNGAREGITVRRPRPGIGGAHSSEEAG